MGRGESKSTTSQRQTVNSTRLRTRIDCSNGQSGAPYTALVGSGYEIVGLHSGYQPGLTPYCGGPKAAQFVDFVDDNLD